MNNEVQVRMKRMKHYTNERQTTSPRGKDCQGRSPVEAKLGSGSCLPADTLVRTTTSLQVTRSKLKILNAAAAAIRVLQRQLRTKGCCAMHASRRQGLGTRHQQRTA
jgi:hypothetical protein